MIAYFLPEGGGLEIRGSNSKQLSQLDLTFPFSNCMPKHLVLLKFCTAC